MAEKDERINLYYWKKTPTWFDTPEGKAALKAQNEKREAKRKDKEERRRVHNQRVMEAAKQRAELEKMYIESQEKEKLRMHNYQVAHPFEVIDSEYYRHEIPWEQLYPDSTYAMGNKEEQSCLDVMTDFFNDLDQKTGSEAEFEKKCIEADQMMSGEYIYELEKAITEGTKFDYVQKSYTHYYPDRFYMQDLIMRCKAEHVDMSKFRRQLELERAKIREAKRDYYNRTTYSSYDEWKQAVNFKIDSLRVNEYYGVKMEYKPLPIDGIPWYGDISLYRNEDLHKCTLVRIVKPGEAVTTVVDYADFRRNLIPFEPIGLSPIERQITRAYIKIRQYTSGALITKFMSYKRRHGFIFGNPVPPLTAWS